MTRRTLAIMLAALLMLGAILEGAPAQARRGGGDSGGVSGNDGRGRGRGQDDVLPEDQGHREGRRGRHHLQGEAHQGRHRAGSRTLQAPDDSAERGTGRGRGQDDR